MVLGVQAGRGVSEKCLGWIWYLLAQIKSNVGLALLVICSEAYSFLSHLFFFSSSFLPPHLFLSLYFCLSLSFSLSRRGTYIFIYCLVLFMTEKAMAPHSSTLAWQIPWMEEPGRLQSMGSQRVGHDWVTSLSLFTFMHWRRKCQPTPVFLPGESQGRVSLVGCRLWGRTELDMKVLCRVPGTISSCSCPGTISLCFLMSHKHHFWLVLYLPPWEKKEAMLCFHSLTWHFRKCFFGNNILGPHGYAGP